MLNDSYSIDLKVLCFFIASIILLSIFHHGRKVHGILGKSPLFDLLFSHAVTKVAGEHLRPFIFQFFNRKW